MIQTKNEAKSDVIKFLLSSSSRPVLTMVRPTQGQVFYVPTFYKPNCFPLSIATQAWSDSLLLFSVSLLVGMGLRFRDHAPCLPVVCHDPANTWSVFAQFRCPPLYNPDCLPLPIATRARSDSLFCHMFAPCIYEFAPSR